MDEPDWDDGRILRTMIARLPDEQIAVIELAFFEGMTHSEMAVYLGLPLGTVKTRVRLGLQKLKYFSRELVENKPLHTP
jgi:RNA polymerase sigma-70 factor (ECF subfamily)